MQQDNDNRNDDVIVVSNRLPVRIRYERGKMQKAPAAGGLASALRAIDTIRHWIGWSGAVIAESRRDAVAEELAKDGLVPVWLTAEEQREYYAGMCNSALWPLLHYFADKVQASTKSWDAYVRVNERFVERILEYSKPGDLVWIHDFHLMLVPQMLRIRQPDLRIGFFLHVPFPSSEVWRTIPQREDLLHGLLGADYIGFHTADYLRHFRDSCLRVLGRDAEPDSILVGSRRVHLGVNALGPDCSAFEQVLSTAEVEQQIARLQHNWGDRRLVLGVERLDYTKGIPRKLLAFERMLETNPERVEDTVMMQVLVPSREDADSYRSLLAEIQREVGRINGRYGKPGRMPLEFLHGTVDPHELAALYRFAKVCIVGPLRDGMNLVAHEFVYCQGHPQPADVRATGMLVLSEFAGAALSLTEAMTVNPWDRNAVALTIEDALAMSTAERDERIASMYEQVVSMDSARWSVRFLERLRECAERNHAPDRGLLREVDADAFCERFAAAQQRVLFLDYDGTLREIVQRPEQAAPTTEILDLLRRLCALPGTEVHIVSGRRRSTLDSWLGELPLHMCAEHGFARREPGGDWVEPAGIDRSWMPEVLEILERASDSLPGSFVERKECGHAWHYRTADPGYGPWRARELQSELAHVLEGRSAEVLSGHAVLEVRASGVDKGEHVRQRCARLDAGTFVFCAGDDRTDQDMFRQVPEQGVAISVSNSFAEATHMVDSPAALRALLARLANAVAAPPDA